MQASYDLKTEAAAIKDELAEIHELEAARCPPASAGFLFASTHSSDLLQSRMGYRHHRP